MLAFRDYVSVELQGNQRFIPVQSDESTILTCFLEYREDFVEVYDLIYRKKGDDWILSTSSYPKLRIDRHWISKQLQKSGFEVLQNTVTDGMVCMVAEKL